MAIDIFAYNAEKPRNSTEVIPQSGSSIPCFLKEDTSVVNPVLQIHCGINGAPSIEELALKNYMYIPAFNRYYWIDDVTFTAAKNIQLSASVDVLATYHDEIFDSEAFVEYSENTYNSMIPDSRLPISDRFTTQYALVTGYESIYSSSGCYVLTTAGSGISSSFVMAGVALQSLSEELFTSDVLEQLVQELNNPLQGLIRCIWLPCQYAAISTGDLQHIKIGSYETGTYGNKIQDLVEGTLQLKPYVPYYGTYYDPTTGSYVTSYSDYRNIAPYTQYMVSLPGCGEIELPMEQCIGTGREEDPIFDAYYYLSPATGDITWVICKQSQSAAQELDGILSIVTGNLGVDIPMSAQQTEKLGVLSASVSQATSAGMLALGFMSGNPFLAISGAGGILTNEVTKQLSMKNNQTGHSGNLGGWNNSKLNAKPRLYTRVYSVSDSPSNVASVIGRPLFMKKQISTLTGLNILSGTRIKSQQISTIELDMLRSTLESKGGVIIA